MQVTPVRAAPQALKNSQALVWLSVNPVGESTPVEHSKSAREKLIYLFFLDIIGRIYFYML